MSIKPWKSRHELAVTLVEERGLNAKSVETVERSLQGKNYFQLVNGIENLLLTNPSVHPKRFTTESFDDFLRIYKFDIKLKDAIFKITEEFEDRLRTAVAYNFGEQHCQGLNNTMQYTNKEMFNNISSDRYYPFVRYQYGRIYNDFDTFLLFKPNFVNNMVRYNEFIEPEFYRDDNYVKPADVGYYRHDCKVAVPIWVMIQTIDFGTLQRFVHYLKPEDLKLVLKEFGLRYSDRYQFLNSLDIIKELRNKCAHGFLMEQFKTPEYLKLNENLITQLGLTPYHTAVHSTPASVIYLTDALRVLGNYQSLRTLRPIFKGLIYQNNRHFNNKNYDLNTRMLSRIHVDSYKALKEICI